MKFCNGDYKNMTLAYYQNGLGSFCNVKTTAI